MIVLSTNWVNRHELGITPSHLHKIFAVANIVGVTIVIPHTRRAAEYWEELGNNE